MNKLVKIIAVLFIPLIFFGCGAMNQKLHIPAKEGNLDKVRAEIEGGTSVDSRDASGQTALMYAAESGRMEVVEYLVSKGADVNAESKLTLITPLFYATSFNRLDVMEFLIANGAKVDALSNWENTALFWAAALGRVDAVNLLLENGADASIENRDGKTALDLARQNNRKDVVQLLESL